MEGYFCAPNTVNGMEACVTFAELSHEDKMRVLRGFKTVNGMEACVTLKEKKKKKN